MFADAWREGEVPRSVIGFEREVGTANISALTFLLLARAFRSLILPLKAVLLNLLSVGAAWGLMVLVWQHGAGSHAIWGIGATG